MNSNPTIVEPTPLEKFQFARAIARTAYETVENAQRVAREIDKLAREARYHATVSVVCPIAACNAAVNEPCSNEGRGSLHRYVTHGIRESFAGVNGEASKERTEKMMLAGKL